ncbi:MAG TPA: hypothetical protein VFE51_14190 [Verrucomicrobiae bacterium]|nr:hypothetical protein [Verrucomicrobiae bacterium]
MATEALPLYANDLPSVSDGSQIVSASNIAGPEMLTDNYQCRTCGLFHIVKKWRGYVMQQKVTGVR